MTRSPELPPLGEEEKEKQTGSKPTSEAGDGAEDFKTIEREVSRIEAQIADLENFVTLLDLTENPNRIIEDLFQ